jgi:membrane protease YdiL (CAAX protease family)
MADKPPEPSEPREPGRTPGPGDRLTLVLAAVLIEGGLAVLAAVLGWLFRHPPVEFLFWEAAGLLWGLAAAVPMVAAFFVMHRWPVGPLARIRRFGEEVVRPLMAPCTVVDLLGISVLAGVGEEMLFRGTLLVACASWLRSDEVAVVVAALAFGLLHAITLTYAVLAALMGVYLGVVFLATGNLLTVIVAHAAYDFAVLVWLLRGPGSWPTDAKRAEDQPPV